MRGYIYWNIGNMEYPYGKGINITMSIKDIVKYTLKN